MNITGQIDNKLRLLRLTGMLETLPVRLKQAGDNYGTPESFLCAEQVLHEQQQPVATG